MEVQAPRTYNKNLAMANLNAYVHRCNVRRSGPVPNWTVNGNKECYVGWQAW